MVSDNNDPLAGVPAVDHSDWVKCEAGYYRKGLENIWERKLLEHIAWERQQRAAVEADAAAMREVMSAILESYWGNAGLAAKLGINESVPLWVQQMQSALSGSAGAALLAERDALRSRVERLRRALKQAASADHGGEGWAVGGYNLEPGDLEEGDQA